MSTRRRRLKVIGASAVVIRGCGKFGGVGVRFVQLGEVVLQEIEAVLVVAMVVR